MMQGISGAAVQRVVLTDCREEVASLAVRFRARALTDTNSEKKWEMTKKMEMNNSDVPQERQMLYILRHWEEMHERLKAEKGHADSLSRELLEERKLRKKANSGYKQLKRLLAKRDAEAGNLQLRLAKSIEKNRMLSERLLRLEQKPLPLRIRLAQWAMRQAGRFLTFSRTRRE